MPQAQADIHIVPVEEKILKQILRIIKIYRQLYIQYALLLCK